MARKNPPNAARSASAARSRRSPTAVRAFRCTARRSTSTRRSSTIARATRVAAASTLEKDLKGALKTGADTAAAAAVGKLIAERATKAGVKEVVFDRGPYIYHGRVKALAEAAREGGLSF